MTGKDAAMFPIIASAFLLGIYIVFKVGICVAGMFLGIRVVRTPFKVCFEL